MHTFHDQVALTTLDVVDLMWAFCPQALHSAPQGECFRCESVVRYGTAMRFHHVLLGPRSYKLTLLVHTKTMPLTLPLWRVISNTVNGTVQNLFSKNCLKDCNLTKRCPSKELCKKGLQKGLGSNN